MSNSDTLGCYGRSKRDRKALIGAGETVSAIVSHIQSDQITGHVFSGFKEGLKMA